MVGRLRPILAWFVLALAAGVVLGAAETGVRTAPGIARATDVELVPQPEGGIVAEAATYRAFIGADGNLHSLRVGDTEMLDDRVAISLGSFFHAEAPLKLGRMTQQASAAVEATDGKYALQYRFLPDEIRIGLRNGGTTPASYVMVLSPEISVASNLQTGEAAAAPVNEQWGEVRFSTGTGAYLDLVGGARIWGPWLKRQVWEASPILAGETREIRLRSGLGAPPKPTLEQLVGVHARVIADNGLVPAGEPIELEVAVDNRSDRALKGQLSLELAGSRSELTIYATSPIELPPKQVTKTRARWQVHRPDFYTARASLSTGPKEIARARATAGYRVPDIQSSVARPEDFDQFWAGVLAEMGREPPRFRMRLDQSRSRHSVAVWVVQYASAANKTIHGWYLVPGGVERPPGVLYLSGYGARPIEPPVALAGRGYVVLAIDVRGNRVDRVRPRPFEDYATSGIERPESYVYREIVGHALRALDFLRARADVDPDRIAVLGVSEGGGLALLLAALRDDIRAVAADAPMLCDYPLSIRSGAWPYTEMSRYLRERPETRQQMERTLAYFDAANFAPDIKCPVLLSVGLLDSVALPAAVYGLANVIPAPTEVQVFPQAGHEGGGQDLWEYKLAWLEKVLAAEPTPK